MARTSTLARFETSGEILSEDTLSLLAAPACKLDGAEMDEGEFAAAWDLLSERWQSIRGEVAGYDTSRLRRHWILPLLELMDHPPKYIGDSHTVYAENRTIPLTHEAGDVKLWLLGYGESYDEKVMAGKRKASPHELFQEYLDLTDDDWGILCNGKSIRLLHDYHKTLTRNYVEADLESIFESLDVDAFRAVWRVFRADCFKGGAKGIRPIENLRDQSRQEGAEIGKELRKQVLEAIKTLGNGFLAADRSGELRLALQSDARAPSLFYSALLRVVYRLLFLLYIENKPGWTPAQDPIWASSYSISRLREQAEEETNSRSGGEDAWEGLKVVFGIIRNGSERFSILPYGGELFNDDRLWLLRDAALQNSELLTALHLLTIFERKKDKQHFRVNFRTLQIDALGSVYEGLLDVSPMLEDDGTFGFAPGADRKLTGSYYTPPELVAELIKSALIPVIDNRLEGVETKKDQETALLSIRVVDPARGSGAFLIQALDALAERLCLIRLGGEEPSDLDIREARRDVVARCIHGVDANPMAVELCKFTLWLHVAHPKFPLSYLEPLVKCGNSLVGVPLTKQVEAARERTEAEQQRLRDIGEHAKAAKLKYVGWPVSIPTEAFAPVAGDRAAVASAAKNQNKEQLKGTLSLDAGPIDETAGDLARAYEAVMDAADDSAEAIREKDERYRAYLRSEEYRRAKRLADLWCAAFYWPLDDPKTPVPTQEWFFRTSLDPAALPEAMAEELGRFGDRVRPFHWEIEFPDVFTQDGFDCVLGNPPWEMLQLEEQEFFAPRKPEISGLTGGKRKRAVAELKERNPELFNEYERALHQASAQNKYFKGSGCFPLTTIAKLNTYRLFSERDRDLLNSKGRAGYLVPTGIATDESNKGFFGGLIEQHTLVALIDYENREGLFPTVDSRFKFSALTVAGEPVSQAVFAFFLTRVGHIKDARRLSGLMSQDIKLINPNTRTSPLFRTRIDADLTRSIYQYVPILVNEQKGENPWSVSFRQGLFNMTSDSGLFYSEPREDRLSLYEGKMVQAYDHRAASVVTNEENLRRSGQPVETSLKEHQDPNYRPNPQFWVRDIHITESLPQGNQPRWFFGFKSVTSPTNERTFISSFLPFCGVGNSMPLIFTQKQDAMSISCLFANLNSLALDYIAKQKVGGVNLNFFYVKQFAVFHPAAYAPQDHAFIAPRVLELVYTAWDMKPFAEDMGYDGPPFVWDEDRRALLRAELDAYYARLYGLTRKQLRYILDPHGLSDAELEDILDPWEEPTCTGPHLLPEHPTEDFPGETFRVLKNNDTAKYGDYRTRRLVLEAWARLEEELGPAKVVNYREMMAACSSRPEPDEMKRKTITDVPVGRRAPSVSPTTSTIPPKSPPRKVDPNPNQLALIETESSARPMAVTPPSRAADQSQSSTADPKLDQGEGKRVLVNGRPALLVGQETKDGKTTIVVTYEGEEAVRKFQSPPARVEDMEE